MAHRHCDESVNYGETDLFITVLSSISASFSLETYWKKVTHGQQMFVVRELITFMTFEPARVWLAYNPDRSNGQLRLTASAYVNMTNAVITTLDKPLRHVGAVDVSLIVFEWTIGFFWHRSISLAIKIFWPLCL